MTGGDEQTVLLRFSLSAESPPSAWDDEDFEGDEWVKEWEERVKPGLVRSVFTYLRQQDGWICHPRNRGIATSDEIEIVVRKTWQKKR